MTDWKTVQLGDVCTLQRGMDLPKRLRHDGDFPLVTSSGIDGTHSIGPVKGPGVITGRYGTIGKVFFVESDFWPLNTTLYVRDFHGNDARFVHYLLQTVDFQSHSGKSGVPGVNCNDVHREFVSVPVDGTEQKRIAQTLLDGDALIDSLEQLLTKKRQIKQGAMQELLTGKRRLPGFTKAWSCDDLRDLVRTPVTDGPHTTPVFVDSGVPFLSVNNLVGNRIDFTDLRFITKEDDQLFARKCKPQRGDVLLGKAASVGKVAIVDDDLDFNIWSPIALIRPVEELDSRFLYYQLQGRPVTTQISVLTNSSSQGNLGMGDIEKLQIAYPCVDEQCEIASVLSDMDTEITALEYRLTKARALKQAMAQALLTGRIRLI